MSKAIGLGLGTTAIFYVAVGLALGCAGQGMPGEGDHEVDDAWKNEGEAEAESEGASEGEAWVPMLAAGRLGASERDLFFGLPMPPNVLRAMSLVPDEVRTLKDLSAAHYLPMGSVRDPRATAGTPHRMQIELIAGRVSALRQCFY